MKRLMDSLYRNEIARVQAEINRAFGIRPTSIEVRTKPDPETEVKISVPVRKPGQRRRS
jgi:hypothetical protein